MRRSRRFVLAVALALATVVGVHVLDGIIRIDNCPTVCTEVRSGQMSWWTALLLFGCWCGDEPPQTEGRATDRHLGAVCRAEAAPAHLAVIKSH